MADHDDVLRTVFDYFEGAHGKDRLRLERAYDVPNAQMKSIVSGPNGADAVRAMPIVTVIEEMWLKGAPTAAPKAQILNFNIVHGRIATVTFDNNGVFLDHLTMFQLNGSWRIVDKVFVRLVT